MEKEFNNGNKNNPALNLQRSFSFLSSSTRVAYVSFFIFFHSFITLLTVFSLFMHFLLQIS